MRARQEFYRMAFGFMVTCCGIVQAQPVDSSGPLSSDPCIPIIRQELMLENQLLALEGQKPLPMPGPGTPRGPIAIRGEGDSGTHTPGETPTRASQADITVWHKANDAQLTLLKNQTIACRQLHPLIIDFDLVADSLDPNGLWLNPMWASQKFFNRLPNNNGIDPTWLTDQPTFKDTNWRCEANEVLHIAPPGPFGGHANWGVATYEGQAFWEGHSSDDGDYNFHLIRPDKAGYTSGNPNYLLLEFDSGETIDNFHTPWWNGLHRAVDLGDAQATSFVGGPKNGAQVIVCGIIGIDCAHAACGSELHPVIAMAVHFRDDPNADQWAIFVRNWGNEGYCGSTVWEVPLTQFTFMIKRPGATAVDTKTDSGIAPYYKADGTGFLTNNKKCGGPYLTLVPGEGVKVTFNLAPASQHSFIDGILQLHWTIGGNPPAIAAATALTNPQGARDNEEGEMMRHYLAMLTPAQRETFERMRPKPPAADPDLWPLERLATPPALEAPGKPIQKVSGSPNTPLLNVQHQEMDALERAYGRKLPPMKD